MNKTILSLLGITLGVGALFATTSSALAYRGDASIQGPNYTAERHEDMLRAFSKNDYNAWKQLSQGNGRVTQIVNKSNFAKYAEMHKLILAGKTDEANKIRTELGLGLRDGSGFGRGLGQGRNTNR